MCESRHTYYLFLHQRALESSLILNAKTPKVGERTRKQWSSIQRGLIFLRGSKFWLQFTWLSLGFYSRPAGSAAGPAVYFKTFLGRRTGLGQKVRGSPLRDGRRNGKDTSSTHAASGWAELPVRRRSGVHVPLTGAMMIQDSSVNSDWFGVKMWKLMNQSDSKHRPSCTSALMKVQKWTLLSVVVLLMAGLQLQSHSKSFVLRLFDASLLCRPTVSPSSPPPPPPSSSVVGCCWSEILLISFWCLC